MEETNYESEENKNKKYFKEMEESIKKSFCEVGPQFPKNCKSSINNSSIAQIIVNRRNSFDCDQSRGEKFHLSQCPLMDDMSLWVNNGIGDMGYLSRRPSKLATPRIDDTYNHLAVAQDDNLASFGFRNIFASVNASQQQRVEISPNLVSKCIGFFIRNLIKCNSHRSPSSIPSRYHALDKPGTHPAPNDLEQIPSFSHRTSNAPLHPPLSRQPLEYTVTSNNNFQHAPLIPSLTIIASFVEQICVMTQMEYECAVISLVYIERLKEYSNDQFFLTESNWKSVVFICMLMANKVNDDFHMLNSDYTQIFPGLELQRINMLELKLLELLDTKLYVNVSEYAKYHFRIQDLITKLGINQSRKMSASSTLISDADKNVKKTFDFFKMLHLKRSEKSSSHRELRKDSLDEAMMIKEAEECDDQTPPFAAGDMYKTVHVDHGDNRHAHSVASDGVESERQLTSSTEKIQSDLSLVINKEELADAIVKQHIQYPLSYDKRSPNKIRKCASRVSNSDSTEKGVLSTDNTIVVNDTSYTSTSHWKALGRVIGRVAILFDRSKKKSATVHVE